MKEFFEKYGLVVNELENGKYEVVFPDGWQLPDRNIAQEDRTILQALINEREIRMNEPIKVFYSKQKTRL